MSTFPPIPKITGDIILETFTHKSLCVQGSLSDESGDNQRLAALGDQVLQLTVTNSLYHKRPLLKAADIPTERDKVLSTETLEKWVAQYRLRDKLRSAPDVHSSLSSPEETRSLFNAYVGAVFTQSGMRIITEWIGRLVDADNIPPIPDDIAASIEAALYDHRPSKKARGDPTLPEIPPPPAPHGSLASVHSTYSQPLVPAANATNVQSNVTFLPMFNQKCTHEKLQVEYQAEFQGPPHAGRWNIKCVVNGVIKGQGQGVSKQIAKEEAAKHAYYGMGWGAHAQTG